MPLPFDAKVGEIAFTGRHVELFSLVTGDTNPIHFDPVLSRSGPFGRPVSFGALSVLAMLKWSEAVIADRPLFLEAAFVRPVFLNAPYFVHKTADQHVERMRLTDGTQVCVDLSIRRSGPPSKVQLSEGFPETTYSVRTEHIRTLGALLEIEEEDMRIALIPLLGWSSYYAGTVAKAGPSWIASLSVQVPGVQDLSVTSTLRVRDDMRGTVLAAVRTQDGRDAEIRMRIGSFAMRIPRRTRPTAQPNGRVALVVGGTRGLGRELSDCLAGAGYAVVSCGRERPADEVMPPGIFLAGDAASNESCKEIADEIKRSWGKIDLLILNAAPRVDAISWHPKHIGRLDQFLVEANRAVMFPLSNFAPLITSQGKLVLISSIAVLGSDRGLAAQRTAKLAAESLVRSAICEWAGIQAYIVRPPRFQSVHTGMNKGVLPSARQVAEAVLRNIDLEANERCVIVDDLGLDGHRPGHLSG